MLVQEFIDKLIEYFGVTNKAVVDGIRSYISRRHISNTELDILFDVIQLNCDKFPLVKTIDRLYQENKIEVKNAKPDWRSRPDWSVAQIISHIQDYWDKSSGANLPRKTDDVAYFYNPLFSAYIDIKEASIVDGTLSFLEQVKAELEAGAEWRKIDIMTEKFIEKHGGKPQNYELDFSENREEKTKPLRSLI